MIAKTEKPRVRKSSVFSGGGLAVAALLVFAGWAATIRADDSSAPAPNRPDPTGWALAVIDHGPSAEALEHFNRAEQHLLRIPAAELSVIEIKLPPLPPPSAEARVCLEAAAADFLAGARFARPDWPPPVDFDNLEGPAPEKLFSELLQQFPQYQQRRRVARLLAYYARQRFHDGQPDAAARLLVALYDYGYGFGRNDYLVGALVSVGVRNIALGPVAEFGPYWPPEVRARLAAELDRRIAGDNDDDLIASFTREFAIMKRALRLLRAAPNRNQLARETWKSLRPQTPKPDNATSEAWFETVREWGRQFVPDTLHRLNLIEMLEQITALHDEILQALRDQRDPNPYFLRLAQLDDEHASVTSLFGLTRGFQAAREQLGRARLVPRLARAGLARYDEPDLERWRALPVALHPETGQPFVVVMPLPEDNPQPGQFYLYEKELPAQVHQDVMYPLRFGFPGARGYIAPHRDRRHYRAKPVAPSASAPVPEAAPPLDVF